MLKIQNLTVQFGKNLVLDNIEAEFPKAQIHGIVGFNGSGKSTLFNTLLGYLSPNEGIISFNEKKLEKGTIGFLPTQNFFYSYLKGKEYLDIFSNNLPETTYLVLEKAVGLPLNELVEGYSSGMKKKLALLGILKLNREIYLLDEPFNGLDIESVFLVKKIAESLKKAGKTVFITNHIP
jgi:ABC-2 type transport system ATP-binding protein